MDKYEYNLKLDQMKSLCAEENYDAAADIADTINWNKAKNVNALCRAGEIYEKIGRYEDAKEVLLLAYDRSPIGRTIIYRLAEVAIKMQDYVTANEYYREFVEIAPRDNLKYVLRYNIKKAQGASYQELIPILEELKEQEYTEEWAYELAYNYHKAGMSDKCIETCDELILWFGDGPYVERALELKMLYQPLSKQQEEKYRLFRQNKAGITTVASEEMEKAGEYGHGDIAIPQVKETAERFNTTNLQQEIAKGMQQILDATEKTTVSNTMKIIKQMAGEIPYLQIPKESTYEDEEECHIETDEEIDGSLKINFQELIGEDNDGQMSLMVEDQNVEKQITGQMSIEDVLEEWEKTKHAAEIAMQEANQRRLESAKARALQEAEDLMDRLQDVIPKLEAGITPKELLEEEYLTNMPEEVDLPRNEEEAAESDAGKIFADMNAMLDTEISRLSAGASDVQELFAEKEEEPQVVSQVKASVLSEPYMTIATEPAKTGSIVVTDEDIERAQDLGETQKMPSLGQIQQEQWAKSETIRIPVDEIREIMAEQQKEAESQEEIPAEAQGLESQEEISAEAQSLESQEEIQAEAQNAEMPTENDESDNQAGEHEQSEMNEEISAEAQAPEEETNEQDEINTQAENLAENIASDNQVSQVPADQELVPEDLNADEPVEEEVKEEAKPEKIVRVPMKSLSKELCSLFSYFVPVKGMEDQLCQALPDLIYHLRSGESAGTGNLIIQGGKASGKTVLATSVIKALQKEISKPAGKVGKISADALNQKDIGQLLKKVAGGCLIIEDAGAISRETAVTMSLLLEHDMSGLLIILEDSTKGIRKALSQDDGFAKKFTSKITVPTFNIDELVAFAKSYAKEKGYEIEEMAVLALYNRISNIQRLDQATTLTEVKDIVDSAIEESAKGGIKKAFSMLTSKRYTEDNRIILRERDFEE